MKTKPKPKSKSSPKRHTEIAPSLTSAAGARGWPVELLQDAKNAGCAAFRLNGNVNLRELDSFIEGRPDLLAKYGTGSPTKSVEAALLMRARRQRAEHDLEVAQNAYLPVDEVRRSFVRLASILKSRLSAIPSSTAPFAVGRNVHEIEELLQGRINDALAAVSNNPWNTNEK